MPGGTLRLWNAGAGSKLPGYKEGAWWVQDIAAHIISRLLGDVAGKKVIDLCAAPGGKSFQILSKNHELLLNDKSKSIDKNMMNDIIKEIMLN